MPDTKQELDENNESEVKEFDVKEELGKLPKKPGVYIMHDADDTILYVGKAKNLHNRVRSYFKENIGRGPQIDKMVSLIARFEYIVTDSGGVRGAGGCLHQGREKGRRRPEKAEAGALEAYSDGRKDKPQTGPAGYPLSSGYPHP